ncbi:MAG: UvrD-helicase domain-containing protein, partial [Deltaproteobacteria bacterium]|nr:UvrD-helicase domain-containing protein [Deltaproteobacteria bacterium]
MQLNPQQQAAVQHAQGPLLILAGAGTGKTRVIVNRIAHLVQNGVPPARILAVTFTNKAAGEMKKRVETLVGNGGRDLWVGTFHSTSLRILRRFALEAGLAPNFVVYDTADQLSCLKQVIKELNLDEKRFPPKSFINKISRWKDQLITAKAFTESARNPIEETFAKIYTAYERILQQNHALDFGDLIARCVFLFQENPKVLEYYQKLWSQVFIDEYQDTNHAQYRWATLLVERHKNICVVGDPDQSIYRWRGADLNNILNFEKDYKEAKVIRLEQNYRSVKKVLDGANAVIANNTLRKEKLLWSDQGEGELLLAASLSTEKEEAKFVVEHFMRQREAGTSYSEM